MHGLPLELILSLEPNSWDNFGKFGTRSLRPLKVQCIFIGKVIDVEYIKTGDFLSSETGTSPMGAVRPELPLLELKSIPYLYSIIRLSSKVMSSFCRVRCQVSPPYYDRCLTLYANEHSPTKFKYHHIHYVRSICTYILLY